MRADAVTCEGRDAIGAVLAHVASFGVVSPLFACLRPVVADRPGALMALARDFSPRVERYADGSVVADVSGLSRLLGDAHGICAELERTAADRGVKACIAVAATQTAARLLTLHPDAPRVVTGDVAAALATLPLSAVADLEPPQAAAPKVQSATDLKIFDTFRRWGLRTIGELANLPADELAARFGQRAAALQHVAQGLDLRPLVPDPGVPRFLQSMELEWPIEELEPLSFVLARLLDPLSLALERADKGAAALRLDLRLVDRTTHTRMLSLPAALRDPRVLRTLLLLDLESHPPSGGIDVVTIEADPAPGRIVQFSLLERATPSPETLATLTARLGALVGDDRCGSPVLLDSHRPDAFEMHRFSPSDVRTQGSTDRRTHGLQLVIRRFRPPVAVRVALERGHPLHVAIDRKGIPGGRVEQWAGPWRTSGAWWEPNAKRWDRDEWDVEFTDGTVCRLFHDRETGRWCVEGVVD